MMMPWEDGDDLLDEPPTLTEYLWASLGTAVFVLVICLLMQFTGLWK